jgi:hypothetical protein
MNDLHEVQRNHSVLKNLNTLYPEILKGIHKMRERFIEKHLREKGLSFI